MPRRTSRGSRGQVASAASGGARLRFPRYFGSDVGFYRPEGEHVVDEIVFRELLQNALDAHQQSGHIGPVEVEFVTTSQRLNEIPGIDDYRRAFGNVLRKLTKGTQKIHGQIAEALALETVDCLICRDNGFGIGADEYQSLLGKGAGLKTDENSTFLGSVGVGHLTSLAPSQLRYVLYASRRPGSGDRLGGQAFLATHQQAGETFAEQGCIADADHDGEFRASEAELAGNPPSWLLGERERGSAVCIVGYEPIDERVRAKFAANPAALGSRIAEIAAKHFTLALSAERMTVSYCDERSGERTEIGVHSDAAFAAFNAAMERVRSEGRSPDGNRDLGAGVRAHSAWKTWQSGEEISPTSTLLAGTKIKWRLTPGERTRVTVFRSGMRISDGISQLKSDKFGEQKRFNAVVAAGGKLERALRECETGTHLKVDTSKRTGEWGRTLRAALNEVAAELRQVVEPRTNESWHPDILNLLFSDNDPRASAGRARPAPPIERTDPLSIDDPPDDDVPERDDPDEPDTPDTPDEPETPDVEKPQDESPSVRRPPEGVVEQLAASLVPGPTGNLCVIWELPEPGRRTSPAPDEVDRVSVMLVSANGSDGACDQPLMPDVVEARESNGLRGADYAPYVHCEPSKGSVELEPRPLLGEVPTLGVDVWLVRTKRQADGQ